MEDATLKRKRSIDINEQDTDELSDTTARRKKPDITITPEDPPLPQSTLPACEPPYEPLERTQIRLLELGVDSDDDSPRCTVTLVDLDSAPQFSALSYTWDSEKDEDDIIICLNQEQRSVRYNLGVFLRRAQSYVAAGHPLFRYIWIDALCINQADNLERQHQVGLMPTIYGRAHRVLVWLGPSSDGTNEIFDCFSKPVSLWRDNSLFSHEWLDSNNPIRSFCYRRYWTRLWVVQELVLARQILAMCGDRVMEGAQFIDAMFELRRHLPPSRNSIDKVHKSPALLMLAHVSEGTTDAPLWKLMCATYHLQCTDPRDKVYGLLGISKERHLGMVADYDMSVADVLYTMLRYQYMMRGTVGIEEYDKQNSQLPRMLGFNEDLLDDHDHSMFTRDPERVRSPDNYTLLLNDLYVQHAKKKYNIGTPQAHQHICPTCVGFLSCRSSVDASAPCTNAFSEAPLVQHGNFADDYEEWSYINHDLAQYLILWLSDEYEDWGFFYLIEEFSGPFMDEGFIQWRRDNAFLTQDHMIRLPMEVVAQRHISDKNLPKIHRLRLMSSDDDHDHTRSDVGYQAYQHLQRWRNAQPPETRGRMPRPRGNLITLF